MKGEGGGIQWGTRSTQAKEGAATSCRHAEELSYLLFSAQICGSYTVLAEIISAPTTFPVGGV